MASISSLSGGSSTNSIYGNANILSGLASGMDTEAMIENAVSGLQNKITSLQQDRTMLEWEQEAYRSIIDKMVDFSNKYASYSSNTNLLSEAFFRNAISVSTSGTNADKVSASGRTSSNVQILGVKQLATAATYTVSGLAGTDNTGKIKGTGVDFLNGKTKVSSVTGSLTLRFGNKTATVHLAEDDVYENVEQLAAGITEKLKGTDLEGMVSAQKDDDGGIKFVISDEQLKNGNNVLKLTAANGDLKTALGLEPSSDTNIHNQSVSMTGKQLTAEKNNLDMLADRKISFTLDGVTKTISFSEENIAKLRDQLEKLDSTKDDYLEKVSEVWANTLDSALDGAFGDGKITVKATAVAAKTTDDKGVEKDSEKVTFSFEVDSDSGSMLTIDNGSVLGLTGNNVSSYVNTSAKLGDLIKLEDYLTPISGNKDESKNGKYALNINGKEVGYFDENSTVEDVINTINNNADSDVTVGFSKLTNQFLFTSKETGAASKIVFDEGLAGGEVGLATLLFGNKTTVEETVTGEDGTQTTVSKIKYEKPDIVTGADSIFSMSVNGKTFDGISRSGNSFDVDGMTVKLEGTFGTFNTGDNNKLVSVDDAKADAVSFTSKTDSEKIIGAIKDMVKDYNEMANEIKNAYATLPLYNSKGQRYEPLTDEDEQDMSDSAVERYNEKAKTGILFGDSTLSSLYDQLRSTISDLGLTQIGITTAYADGKTTLVLDEAKLKETLDSDPEKVTSLFTKSRDNGASSDGFMTKLKNTMDVYAKTTGSKGILINMAGSTKSALSLLNNNYKDQIDKIDENIERWQTKLSNKIDYYNKQFTRLETLISEMNSQSSTLMGLMGY